MIDEPRAPQTLALSKATLTRLRKGAVLALWLTGVCGTLFLTVGVYFPALRVIVLDPSQASSALCIGARPTRSERNISVSESEENINLAPVETVVTGLPSPDEICARQFQTILIVLAVLEGLWCVSLMLLVMADGPGPASTMSGGGFSWWRIGGILFVGVVLLVYCWGFRSLTLGAASVCLSIAHSLLVASKRGVFVLVGRIDHQIVWLLVFLAAVVLAVRASLFALFPVAFSLLAWRSLRRLEKRYRT